MSGVRYNDLSLRLYNVAVSHLIAQTFLFSPALLVLPMRFMCSYLWLCPRRRSLISQSVLIDHVSRLYTIGVPRLATVLVSLVYYQFMYISLFASTTISFPMGSI